MEFSSMRLCLKRLFAIPLILFLGTSLAYSEYGLNLLGSGNAGPGGVAATQPDQISELEFWVTAKTGVWQDTAATTVADDNDEVVNRWDDQSSGGNNIQNTAGLAPLLKTGLALTPVIQVTGSGDRDFDKYDIHSKQTADAFSLLITGGWAGAPSVYTPIFGRVQSGEYYIGTVNNTDWSVMIMTIFNSFRIEIDTNIPVVDGEFEHFVVTYDGSGNASGVKIYNNGSLVTGFTTNSDTLGANEIQDTAARFQIGRTTNYGNSTSKNLAEGALWGKELSVSEVAGLWQYTQDTWGLE